MSLAGGGGVGGARGEGLRGNGVLMRIPCACSVRGLSVGSAVEYEEQEQALNLAETSAPLKQQHKLLCFIWPGPH